METSNLKNCRTYVLFTLWSILACATIGFWVAESVLVLQGSKNSTNTSPPIIQVKSLIDTMMMDQMGNKSFDTMVVMNRKNNTIDRFRQMDEVNRLMDKMNNANLRVENKTQLGVY